MYVIITDNSIDYLTVLSRYLKYDTSVPNNMHYFKNNDKSKV